MARKPFLPVVLSRSYGSNNPGELCGFPRTEAVRLVAAGHAKPHAPKGLPEADGWDVAALLDAGVELPKPEIKKPKPEPEKPKAVEPKAVAAPQDKQIRDADEVTK